MVNEFTPIAERAGIGPIPRPFNNMRMSRSNEVDGEYGVKEESLWIGHSTKTFKDHYGVTTEEDFKKAVARKVIKSVNNPDAGQTAEMTYSNQDYFYCQIY